MIDVSVLRGSRVRSEGGESGVLSRVSLPWVRIEWQQEDGSVRSQSLLRSSLQNEGKGIEVLTMDRGWVSLGSLIGVKEEAKVENYDRVMGLVEDVRDILDLHEQDKASKKIKGKFKKATKHNPFKYLKKGKALGPGPRGSTEVPGTKTGYWRCRCHSYKCLCRGTEGERKRVDIEKGYKATYNKAYRKWRKRHKNKYQPGKGSKWKKRTGGTTP